MAQIIYKEAKYEGLQGNRWIPECLYFEQNYTILYRTNCPAILTENLFMDNFEDAQYLLSNDGKETITRIHLKSILKYIENL